MPEWTDTSNKELTARQVALAKLMQNYFGDTKIKYSTVPDDRSMFGTNTSDPSNHGVLGQYDSGSDSIAVYTDPNNVRFKGHEPYSLYHEMGHRAQFEEINYSEQNPIGRLRNLINRLSGKGSVRDRLVPGGDYEPFAEGLVRYINNPKDTTVTDDAKSIYDKLLRGYYKRK